MGKITRSILEDDYNYVKYENIAFLITAVFYLVPLAGAIYRISKYSNDIFSTINYRESYLKIVMKKRNFYNLDSDFSDSDM